MGKRKHGWNNIIILHQHNLLINEQQISDINPLYELAGTSRIPLQKNAA
jgi:hypothetical protein